MSYPACKTARVNTNNNTGITGQLELSLNSQRRAALTANRQTRIERATWWFTKMRSAVDSAITWNSGREAHPEQMRLV